MFITHVQFSHMLARSWCGISACFDGTEDASIHCLKFSGVGSEAFPMITENTATLLSEAQRQDDDRDPFADLDDDEKFLIAL